MGTYLFEEFELRHRFITDILAIVAKLKEAKLLIEYLVKSDLSRFLQVLVHNTANTAGEEGSKGNRNKQFSLVQAGPQHHHHHYPSMHGPDKLGKVNYSIF